MQNDEKKEFISDIVGKISEGKSENYTEGMPTFDLGQQILSQQRKIASMKRKSPGAAPAPVTEKIQAPKPAIKIMPFQALIEQPMSPQQRIIADIIAREIQILTSAAR
ncbi:MAG: hypothetical protein A2Y12_16765 [Planctomycetes bacterium GWF2_42_9]|nr:MAG: hypothetical protein A2Y12_16765 [Planctomycetes bacterium GWF2_42_9]HAL44510.1 hypothetical protein [Phycisphaerales bacterium]